MSLLNKHQRAVICADTQIDPLIVDRCVEAFDALIQRGDVDAFKTIMAHAWAQQGYGPGTPIQAQDRPTALDKIKTICVRAYADQQHISFQKAAARLKRMIEG